MTGATGFVGQRLTFDLLANVNQVKALVRKHSNVLSVKVEQIVIEDLARLSLKNHPTTIQDDMFFDGVDVVIHAAARVHIMHDVASDPLIEFRTVNRDATLALARMAAEAGVKRFVFLSSIGVNGNNNLKPFTEQDEPAPHDLYAISKYEAEQGLLAIAEETGMEVVIIRPPLVYGANAPGNFGSLVKWMRKPIPLPLGAIHNQRSLVAVDNLVDFITLCADREKSPKAANQVFLISDGEDVSTTTLLQKVGKAFGKKPRLIPVPVGLMIFAAKLIGKSDMANRLFGSLQVDSSKARDLLGWQPVVTMDEQLAKMVEVDENMRVLSD
jgi:nucleoside-diphosphate-sugar epimerase